MNENYKSFILAKILSESGIVIAPIHSLGIITYVEKLLEKNNMTVEDYCDLLTTDKNVLNDLINQATTNETYFFREEKQFDYLKNELFPKYRFKNLVIWSAACSTGEEPLSLLALAMEFNINVTIYASDIDDNVLNFFKKGEYTKYSFRADGCNYHHYLDKLGNFNEDKSKFIFKPEVLNKIKIFKYNLTDFDNFPIHENIDIIFMRNVFIYFDQNTRKTITEKVTKKLNENGHLFYSINEIGNINKNIVPEYMKKNNNNHIYYYTKQTDDTNKKMSSLKKDCEIKPKDIFQELTTAIVKKDYDKATLIASEYKPAYTDSFYSSFFKGYVSMECKNYQEAERYFITSEFMKNEFWPAYFYHGILLENTASKEKASVCFKKCIEIMNNDFSKNDYDFLLKDKSSSFVYTYCSNFIKE